MGHDDVQAFLAEARTTVDRALERWLPVETQGAPRLAEAMRYSLFAGGKRIRPALALASCRALGGTDGAVLPYACALELIHTYSLIHDDLPAMDDDDLRRGRPTSHKVYGDALAILTGDALHTQAFDIVLRHTEDPALARALACALAAAAGFDGMVGGQVDDMAAEGEASTGTTRGGESLDLARLQRIHARKTGALLRASTRGGALAAGAADTAVEALDAYGAALGLAFQITDDILDVTGSAETLGKTPGKDAREDKLTYVALEGVAGARARAEAEIERALEALDRLADLPSFDPEILVALAQFVAHRDR